MVYVVEKTTGKILYRADAWERYAPERLAAKAVADGYTLLEQFITPMGDMVIYVTKEV